MVNDIVPITGWKTDLVREEYNGQRCTKQKLYWWRGGQVSKGFLNDRFDPTGALVNKYIKKYGKWAGDALEDRRETVQERKRVNDLLHYFADKYDIKFSTLYQRWQKGVRGDAELFKPSKRGKK